MLGLGDLSYFCLSCKGWNFRHGSGRQEPSGQERQGGREECEDRMRLGR